MQKNAAAAYHGGIFLFRLLALALLICNTAAGLASRLAGGLALAATAVLCALAKVLGVQSLNVFHILKSSDSKFLLYFFIFLCCLVEQPCKFQKVVFLIGQMHDLLKNIL